MLIVAAVTAEAPLPAYFLIAGAGLLFLRFRAGLQKLFMTHPIVPSVIARPFGLMALGLAWFFGLAFVLIGIAGVVLKAAQLLR